MLMEVLKSCKHTAPCSLTLGLLLPSGHLTSGLVSEDTVPDEQGSHHGFYPVLSLPSTKREAHSQTWNKAWRHLGPVTCSQSPS